MKAAFATWDSRVAPVFDIARDMVLVDADAGRIVGESQEVLSSDIPAQKALRLAELGVDTLVCGGISRPLLAIITGYGIRVIPFIAGDLREVIQAWLCGRLTRGEFAMPGCWKKGRGRARGVPGGYQEGSFMRGTGGRGGGGGQGGGFGGRQGGGRGQRAGRMGGPKAAGPEGFCVCPQCGRKEPHERGVPCTQKKCPNCGVPLTRE